MKKGYSVIEILVVIGVFAVLAVVATQSVSLSLRSSKKSDSTMVVRNELDYAAGSIERNLQFAGEIIVPNCTDVDTATNIATPSVGFRDKRGFRGDIACLDVGNINVSIPFYNTGANNDVRIASSSGEIISYKQRLTSLNVNISGCSFICSKQGEQTYLEFTVVSTGRNVAPEENTIPITISKKILVRDVGKR